MINRWLLDSVSIDLAVRLLSFLAPATVIGAIPIAWVLGVSMSTMTSWKVVIPLLAAIPIATFVAYTRSKHLPDNHPTSPSTTFDARLEQFLRVPMYYGSWTGVVCGGLIAISIPINMLAKG